MPNFSDPEFRARAMAARKEKAEARALEKESDADVGGGIPEASDLPADAPRKRGRPKGSTNRESAAPRRVKNLDSIVAMLVSVHGLAAAKTGRDWIAIDADEARMLAQAASDVLDQYKIKVDGKTGALLMLCYAATVVYAPRVVIALNERRGAPTSGSAAEDNVHRIDAFLAADRPDA